MKKTEAVLARRFQRSGKLKLLALISCFYSLTASVFYSGQANAQDLDTLAQMDFEDLLEIDVTSVSRKEERAFGAAAALYVITPEMIKRSGYTTVMELMRLVPGFAAARFTSSDWAISGRGFQAGSANKLLVLQNGRSLYTSPFGGVYWDAQELVLEDIDRIEVIRGPGATLWGTNAVNGIINIITKDTNETRQGLVTLTAGNEARALLNLRYGAALNKNSDFRVYARGTNRDGNELVTGGDAGDKQRTMQAGFEYDWQDAEDSLSLEGRLFEADLNTFGPEFGPPPQFNISRGRNNIAHNEGHILGRWARSHSDDSETSLRLYAHHQNRDMSTNSNLSITTYDADLQHQLKLSQWLDLVAGLSHRLTDDKLIDSSTVYWDPTYRKTRLYAAFIQNQISMMDDKLNLTMGVKLEKNDFSGYETQPNVRLAWAPSDKNTVWASFSRAVRIPSRQFSDGSFVIATIPSAIPGGAGLPFGISGSPDGLEGENLFSYELGFRSRISDNFTLDFAAYYNDYKDLLTVEVDGGPGGIQIIDIGASTLPAALARFGYGGAGAVYGMELTASYLPAKWWKLEASYWNNFSDIDGTGDIFDTVTLGSISPEHTAVLRSMLDVTDSLTFDTILRYTDVLPPVLGFGGAGDILGTVPATVRLDARVGWQINKNWELSIVGLGLLDSSQKQFIDEFGANPVAVERSVFGRVTWLFDT